MSESIIRCGWANGSELEQQYHDTEWGVPVHDDRALFRMLMLECMQAGLSWSIILKKRETLCAAFDDFDPSPVARYNENKVAELLQNDGIIKNRLKVAATINNAQRYFELCERHGSLDNFLWSYVNYQPIINRWTEAGEVPSTTPLSDLISKDLKRLGFKFVGSTVVYAFMQSVGIVNDHLLDCHFRNAE